MGCPRFGVRARVLVGRSPGLHPLRYRPKYSVGGSVRHAEGGRAPPGLVCSASPTGRGAFQGPDPVRWRGRVAEQGEETGVPGRQAGGGERGSWRRVLRSEALPEGAGRGVQVFDGTRALELALFRTGAGLFAIENVCPHQGAPLHDGRLEGTLLRCRWHGWPFDLRTGRPPVGAFPCVRTFAVEERDGWIRVRLDAGDEERRG
ncbi:MAG: Rieske (2Fe-2S) protein [Planctomycetota bacterium]|nr:MAG: Rieske (2Fe-2S) protein [Planctomycetota bacterium]